MRPRVSWRLIAGEDGMGVRVGGLEVFQSASWLSLLTGGIFCQCGCEELVMVGGIDVESLNGNYKKGTDELKGNA